MSIELRLSDIAPPAPEPPRTVYGDILNLPDPVTLSITFKAYNYDSVTLYFQITITGAGWTFPASTNLGSIISGANTQFHQDQYGTRAKPAAETTESLTLTLRAYTDAGYSNLKWTFVRTVTVWFIKSDDGSWTQDILDNFDDGGAHGWAAVVETGGTASGSVASDYVLSVPYSFRVDGMKTASGPGELRYRIEKAITTPNRAKVLAIANLRFHDGANTGIKKIDVLQDSTIIVEVGKPVDSNYTDYIPEARWLRIVIPLTPNVSITLKYVIDGYVQLNYHMWLNFDDFTVISKN